MNTYFENDNLAEIIYEEITPEYGRGRYAGIEIIIMKKNGYVNATKLCQQSGKDYRHYCENKEYKELENEMASLGIPRDEDLKVVKI